MEHYMPEIFWHDRKALLSVDFHPVVDSGAYRIVTSSVQKEVRIWRFEYEQCLKVPSKFQLAVTFLANLSGHNVAINQVKFSQNPEVNLLASGDSDGRIAIWHLSEAPSTAPPVDDLPPNKENWIRLRVLNHDSEVTNIAWSPDGKLIASVSNDESLFVHDVTSGKRCVSVRNLRHFPSGVAWDPKGKYIVTMSTDRKMDLIDAVKGTRLRAFGVCALPAVAIGDITLEHKVYKLFHDDQLMSFQRGVAFSPCGQLIIAPCANLEVGTHDLYGTLVFRRSELENDKPLAFLPCPKATFLIRCCPLIMTLEKEETNYSGLPYRILWLALTKDSVYLYDSQHPNPIGLVENIQYNSLTDAAWSSDGKNIVISSLEGYCTFLKLTVDQWGCKIENERMENCPPSPQLIQTKKRKPREKKVKENKDEEATESPAPSQQRTTPLRPAAQQVTTPRSGSLFRYLQTKGDESPRSAQPASPTTPSRSKAENTPSQPSQPPIAKKRIALITLPD
ncbi:WD domain, G-beta repeat protein [Ancylostoma caninum]|uniref:WD domain, G-beta repeat protein n=1 Tax=Ancylostoma caninum TaxID=29170 RepID=A0A368GA21_ANCCA|nr:WD domain, G-beta repeat protein [Ancylostoma caninum]